MPVAGLFDGTFRLLERVLDLRLQNQQLISGNIANAETPGYAPARLDFEAGLRRAEGRGGETLARTRPGHLAPTAGEAPVRREPGGGAGDKNGVDLDGEMLAMAENQILYEAATQMVTKKLGLLKYVSQDGR